MRPPDGTPKSSGNGAPAKASASATSGCRTRPPPRLSSAWGERSNTSTCQPMARRQSAVNRPPREPPMITARGVEVGCMVVREVEVSSHRRGGPGCRQSATGLPRVTRRYRRPPSRRSNRQKTGGRAIPAASACQQFAPRDVLPSSSRSCHEYPVAFIIGTAACRRVRRRLRDGGPCRRCRALVDRRAPFRDHR
ncbi:hypothetical protein D3C87_1510480 [compost metagenome]